MYAQENQREHERFEVDAAVVGQIGGRDFEGRVSDISMGGAAIMAPDTGYQNDQFVRLHMEGMGETRGYVRRGIPGGFALQFEEDDLNDEERKRREEAIKAFREQGARARRA